MILVIFEVTIREDRMGDYLSIAAELKESLAGAKGFIRSERFSSLTMERKLLSLSFWEDEEAVTGWRNQFAHRQGQRRGREALFERYTITVAASLRSYTDADRQQAPRDSNSFFGFSL